MTDKAPENYDVEILPPPEDPSLPTALPAAPAIKSELIVQFVAGFLGWFLIAGMLWGSGIKETGPKEEYILLGSIFIMPFTVGILIILGIIKRTRVIALGILAAIGVNAGISVLLGLFLNAFCLVPFFAK